MECQDSKKNTSWYRRFSRNTHQRCLLYRQNQTDRAAYRKLEQSESFYSTASFWKDTQYEHAENFFWNWHGKAFFDGLYITQNKVLCEQHLGKYPVIFLSLKDVAGLTFEEAVDMLVQLIGREAKRFSFLQNSPQLSVDEQEQYKSLIAIKNGKHWMDKGLLVSSLIVLSQLLCQHYGQKVIILIDEYDVPLDKAFQSGYYREMVSLIRSLFGQALKTNSFLQFAVLTGCLRVSKESIFTGLNNFKVHSVDDVRYDEEFWLYGRWSAAVTCGLWIIGSFPGSERNGMTGTNSEMQIYIVHGNVMNYVDWSRITPNFCQNRIGSTAVETTYWNDLLTRQILRHVMKSSS